MIFFMVLLTCDVHKSSKSVLFLPTNNFPCLLQNEIDKTKK